MKIIVREPKWSRSSPSVIELESEDGNKFRDTASEESKAKEKLESDRYLHNTSLTFGNSSDHHFAIFTAISHPQHLAPTCYTWLQRISTCVFPDIFLREAYSAHAHS